MSEREIVTCGLCGEPMPPGEEMFKYHGFSGPCPKSPMPVAEDESDEEAARPEGSGDSWAPPLRRPVPLATPKQQTPNLMEALKQSLRNAKLGEPTPPATPQWKIDDAEWAAGDDQPGSIAPPATPRGSCAFGQHEWKGTNAEGSCICGELTLSRTPPATPQPETKACGHRGPCECAHYIDPTRPALSPPPDVERLTREAFKAGFLAVCRKKSDDTPLDMLTRVWTFDGVAAADLEPEAYAAWRALSPSTPGEPT